MDLEMILEPSHPEWGIKRVKYKIKHIPNTVHWPLLHHVVFLPQSFHYPLSNLYYITPTAENKSDNKCIELCKEKKMKDKFENLVIRLVINLFLYLI
jgi:hypothetical protein